MKEKNMWIMSTIYSVFKLAEKRLVISCSLVVIGVS